MAARTAAPAAIPPAGASPASPEAGVAAGLRALRDALACLAGQYGYRRNTPNEVLLALGADRRDVEALRAYLAGHDPGGEGETT